MSAIPGRIGRYRIDAEIGRGAMGVVYRGEDEALGRSVAVKTILASMDSGEHAGYLARFRQEAKALGGLSHPAIISVYEFGDEIGGLTFLAMEYLEGRELRDVMESERLPVTTAVEIALQIAEGLAFAHTRGIVHRDIKPSNIMVLPGNRVKIMDFGIARVRVSDVKTQTGLVLGSPKYMSPEQVLGRPVDNRADIFSLGVLLYEMLAGAAPFTGENVHQLMLQICNGRAAAPSRFNPAVPEVLDLIVAKALEKTPELRYQDAAQLAADLRACAAASPATAPIGGDTLVQAPIDATLVMERTQALEPERTVLLSTGSAVASVGLHLARRFDSQAALRRLLDARGQDRAALSPAGGRKSLFAPIIGDRTLGAAVAMLLSAVLAAVAIAILR